jgi:SAM-dependent methyltransferase
VTRGVPGRWSVWRYNWLVHRRVIDALIRARPHARGWLLDVGCGDKPFARWFDGHVTHYLGTDLRSSRYLGDRRPEVFAHGERLPFRGGSFETVLGLSMLDHFPEPARLLDEARRVLKPGGALLLEFPQMVPLHDEPYDYLRFTRYGAAWLLERSGFEPVEFIPLGGLMTKVGLTTIAGLNRINRGPTRVVTELPVRALYVVLQLLFAALDRLFFDPREVIAHLVVARRRDTPSAG